MCIYCVNSMLLLFCQSPALPAGTYDRPHTHTLTHSMQVEYEIRLPPLATRADTRPSAHEHRPWTRRRHAHSYGHINYITPRAHPSHYTRLPPIRPPRIRVCKDGLSLFLHQEQHFGRLEEFDRLLLGWAILELVLGGGRLERQRERRTGAACGRGELTRQQ